MFDSDGDASLVFPLRREDFSGGRDPLRFASLRPVGNVEGESGECVYTGEMGRGLGIEGNKGNKALDRVTPVL
jgi:hypothetical protein